MNFFKFKHPAAKASRECTLLDGAVIAKTTGAVVVTEYLPLETAPAA